MSDLQLVFFIDICRCITTHLLKLDLHLIIILIDRSPDEFDVLCSYLSLPSSLADMFSQGADDIVSNLVSQ